VGIIPVVIFFLAAHFLGVKYSKLTQCCLTRRISEDLMVIQSGFFSGADSEFAAAASEGPLNDGATIETKRRR
jgi:hypothetical protein